MSLRGSIAAAAALGLVTAAPASQGAPERVAGLGWTLSSGAGPVAGTGAPPALVAAPTLSAAPTVTQGPSSTTWTGNTITVSNGTWNNCASCNYSYQWWNGTAFHNAVIAEGGTTNAYAVPSSSTSSVSPQAGTALWATVTATNAAGAAMSAVLPTSVQANGMTGNPSMQTAPTLGKCTDSTCTTVNPIGNTLANGDWLEITSPGIYNNAPGWTLGSTPYTWYLQSEATGGSPVALVGNGQTFQIPPGGSITKAAGGVVSTANAIISASVNIHTSVGSYNFNTAWYGTIQSSPSTIIPAPIASQIPLFVPIPSTAPLISTFTGSASAGSTTLTASGVTTPLVLGEAITGPNIAPATVISAFGTGTGGNGTYILSSPTAHAVSGTITGTNVAFVGTTLQYQALDSAIWSNPFPTGVTYQWYYCNAPCTAPPLGGTLSGTPINSFSGTSFQGATIHVVDSADIGKQIFLRITASTSGGSTSADSTPTPVIQLPPSAPIQTGVALVGGSPTGQPSITGLPVYGSVGAGSGGATLVGDLGSWNLASTMATTWYSCPPATPNCTTPATGPTSLTQSNGYGRVGETYQIQAADLGNVLVFNATGGNIKGIGEVSMSSAPTAVVAAYTPPPNLPETPVRTYPTGQDLGSGATACSAEPADAPDSGAHTYYVNVGAAINGAGAGDTPTSAWGGISGGGTNTADGSKAHPFNSLHALFQSFGVAGYGHPLVSTANNGVWNPANPPANYINPGDRVIVEGGAGADYGAVSTYGTTQNVDGASPPNTKWIKIWADPGTSPPPTIDGLNLISNRGLEFKGFTYRPGTGTGPMVSVSQVAAQGVSQDIIIADSLISPWDSMSAAQSAYNAACITGSCPYSGFVPWATANSRLGVMVTGDAGPTNNGGSTCVAIVHNHIMLTNGGIQLQSIYPRSVLVDSNEIEFTLTQDLVDYDNSASIFHLNYEHDPIGGISATGTHVDGFQSQTWNNLTWWGAYGLVLDGNIEYSSTTTDGAILKAFPDQKQCPGSGVTCNYAATMSFEEGTGNFYAGNKRINNVMVNGDHMNPPRSALGTYANNTLLSDGTVAGTFETGLLSNSDYVANNVANNWTCPTGVTSTWPSNLGVAWGPAPTMPNSVAGCPTGVTDSSATTSPVVSWSPWNNGNAVNPATINLHPASGGALQNTGTAGNGAPTVDISGAARSATAPSIGAYE